MNLIIINGYTPPSPSKYEVAFSNVNGASETLENGYTYIEQTRAQVPSISLAWTNISESEANDILDAIKPALFTASYLFGGMQEDTFSCDSPKLTLVLAKESERIFNVSLTLKG